MRGTSGLCAVQHTPYSAPRLSIPIQMRSSINNPAGSLPSKPTTFAVQKAPSLLFSSDVKHRLTDRSALPFPLCFSNWNVEHMLHKGFAPSVCTFRATFFIWRCVPWLGAAWRWSEHGGWKGVNLVVLMIMSSQIIALYIPEFQWFLKPMLKALNNTSCQIAEINLWHDLVRELFPASM